MGFLLGLGLVIVFGACVGFLYNEGIWGNFLNLVNVTTAALLATNYFEPLAKLAEGYMGSFTFFLDFLSLWALFSLFSIVFRLLTDRISRTKVRFLKVADQIGSPVMAALVGVVMVNFTAMTLHTAPLAKNFLDGGFQPEERMLMGTAPDRQWLGFVQILSRNAYCRNLSSAEKQNGAYGAETDPEEQNLAVFDRGGEFILKYTARRTLLENYLNAKDKGYRVATEDLGQRIPNRDAGAAQ
jgi:hypothetical protein